MSRLYIKSESQAQAVVDELYRSIENRIAASPPGLCPVDMALNFLNLCHAQTCGKCVPVPGRPGAAVFSMLQRRAGRQRHRENTLQLIEDTAQVVVDTDGLCHRHPGRAAGPDGCSRASGTTMRSTSSITAAWAA